MNLTERKSNKKMFIEVLIPLLYICAPYNIVGLPLSSILMIIGIIHMFIRGYSIKMYKPLLALFVFMMAHDLIKMVVVPLNYGVWLERLVFFVFLSCVVSEVDYEKLYKAWSVIGYLAIIGIFYQSIQVYLMHTPVTMIHILPFLESTSDSYDLAYLRPHSFFLEPASYTTWIIPLLCMNLERSKLLGSLIITISVLLSTSSTGVILVAVVWVYFAISSRNDKNKPMKRIAVIAGGLLIIGAFLNVGIFSASVEKLMNISIESTTNSVRLILGYRLFWAAPIVYKILGIPYMDVESYLRYGGIDLKTYYLSYNLSYLGYVNAIGNCMLMYGIPGLLLYLRLFWKMWSDIDPKLKVYLVTCIISAFGQSVFWNTLFVTQFAIMLGCSKNAYNNSIKLVLSHRTAGIRRSMESY